MNKVFIYWDNAAVYPGAQAAAAEREGYDARYRVRVYYPNIFALARAGREVGHATAVGPVPAEMRHCWNRAENEGAAVDICHSLTVALLRDLLDSDNAPGTAAVVTGDGDGFSGEPGFHYDLELMRDRGWDIEVLSWRGACDYRMREWAENAGRFVALDDFYESVTLLEPPRPGDPIGSPRHPVPVDLSKRLVAV